MTDCQIEALRAASRGEVVRYDHMFCGARKQTVISLVKRGLLDPYNASREFAKFRPTKAGYELLREVRNGS